MKENIQKLINDLKNSRTLQKYEVKKVNVIEKYIVNLEKRIKDYYDEYNITK